MFSPSEINKILKTRGLAVKKSFGQNFLVNERIRDRMIESCAISPGETVLEIGPGLGVLTEKIAPLCKKLVCVEKDRGFAGFLKDELQENENIEIINSDVLDLDIRPLYESSNSRIKVIGNLPFYITSPIIFHLLESRRFISSIYITVQKEVAQRMAAGPGTKDYGLLSVSSQYHCAPEIMLKVPRSSFFPAPEVDAAFIKLGILSNPSVSVLDEDLFFKVVRSAFMKRRKTLFNALLNSTLLTLSKEQLEAAFDMSGLDKNIRGEQLSPEQFAGLSDAIEMQQP